MTSARPAFEPDGTSVAATAVRDEGSPSGNDAQALARFEFESGRGNEGTKILMVEWEDKTDGVSQTGPNARSGDWHVSWPGKSTVLPTNDLQLQQSEERTRRLYFLLPPGVTVPPVVTLAHRSSLPQSTAPDASSVSWQIKPLPAIFPPQLGASARTAGKKGVLHTIWAKKRVSVLEKEIAEETRNNFEGIGLEMVLQEKEWIEQNFGVTSRSSAISSSSAGADGDTPPSPLSPRSPGGSRLTDKLKGLRLGTSVQELNAQSNGPSSSDDPLETTRDDASEHPLSPETSDVAISSFAAFHGATASNPSATKESTAQRRTFAARAPPASVRAQQTQQQSQASRGSLNSVLATTGRASSSGQSPPQPRTLPAEDSQEEGLFAVAMSPRSPDMAKSPFSFSTRDTMAPSAAGR